MLSKILTLFQTEELKTNFARKGNSLSDVTFLKTLLLLKSGFSALFDSLFDALFKLANGELSFERRVTSSPSSGQRRGAAKYDV